MTVFASPRLATLDLVRTLALALMIAYHTIFDLRVFFATGPDPLAPQWRALAIIAASLFLLCSGASIRLAWEKRAAAARLPWVFKRLFILGACALLVTLASAVVVPQSYVQFGILHCIAVGSLITVLVLPLGAVRCAACGIGVIFLGLWLPSYDAHRSFVLTAIGFPGASFHSVDYFPLLPWAGVMLLGSAVLPDTLRRLPAPSDAVWLRALAWPSRHSLLIYLVHQPLLLLILYGILG